jgi:hypothetical protein
MKDFSGNQAIRLGAETGFGGRGKGAGRKIRKGKNGGEKEGAG